MENEDMVAELLMELKNMGRLMSEMVRVIRAIDYGINSVNADLAGLENILGKIKDNLERMEGF